MKPTDESVPYRHFLITGEPANAILRLAEEEEVDMIVMSTAGRSGLSRAVLGSTAEQIVRRAPCSVLTVRPS